MRQVFSFTTAVNQRFMHGVPRAQQSSVGPAPRFSIIAWGKRRVLTPRNAGADELKQQTQQQQRQQQQQQRERTQQQKQQQQLTTPPASLYAKEPDAEKEIAMDIKEVTALIEQFVITQNEANKKAPLAPVSGKSRVQGGWAATGGRGRASGGGGGAKKPAAAAAAGRGMAAMGRGGGGWAAAMGANKLATSREEDEEDEEEEEEEEDE
jgi:hypothetical protein